MRLAVCITIQGDTMESRIADNGPLHEMMWGMLGLISKSS
jgi:hypothetical protein